MGGAPARWVAPSYMLGVLRGVGWTPGRCHTSWALGGFRIHTHTAVRPGWQVPARCVVGGGRGVHGEVEMASMRCLVGWVGSMT